MVRKPVIGRGELDAGLPAQLYCFSGLFTGGVRHSCQPSKYQVASDILVFQVFYVFLSVGLFLLFVLEAGKTMVQSYEDTSKKIAEREATRRAKNQANEQGGGGASRV